MIRILRILINLPILVILPKIIFQLILSQLHQHLHPFLFQLTLPIIQLTLDPLIFLNPFRQIMILRPQNPQIFLRIILPQIPLNPFLQSFNHSRPSHKMNVPDQTLLNRVRKSTYTRHDIFNYPVLVYPNQSRLKENLITPDKLTFQE